MRECLKLIYERVSIRKYLPDEIDDETILEILRAGNAAPTAGNLQARDFIVVKSYETKRRIAEAALEQMFIATAPVVIVVCANYPRSMRIYGERGKLYAEQDATAAVENILLAAHALGLGAVWVGAFDEEEISKILDIPGFVRPIAIIPVGYPAEKPGKRNRYPIEELVHWEKWQEKDMSIEFETGNESYEIRGENESASESISDENESKSEGEEENEVIE